MGECREMIGIRADGNEKIGTGHVMRCLSIGDAIRKKGGQPVYFSVDAEGIIREAGFECVPLQGVFDDLSKEDILPLLRKKGVTTLLVDSYFADAAYFKRLCGQVKTAVVFDMGDGNLPVDLLVNYNLDHDSHTYAGPGKLLLGCRYAPLRAEFQNLCIKRKFDEAKNVMITTGGTDKYNITAQAVRMIRKDAALKGVVLHVVVGALNAFAADLRRIAREEDGIVLYENFRDMASLMQRCDVAISAGGSTLYEICACGIPCITFSMADNQENVVEVMQANGIMLSAGHYERDAGACMDSILTQLKMLTSNGALRKEFSLKETSLVDGNGAGRLAGELIKLDTLK